MKKLLPPILFITCSWTLSAAQIVLQDPLSSLTGWRSQANFSSIDSGSVRINSDGSSNASIARNLNASRLSGKKIRITLEARGDNVAKGARPFMQPRINLNWKSNGKFGFKDRALPTGTYDWQTITWEHQLPDILGSLGIQLGFFKAGGTLWLRNLKIEDLSGSVTPSPAPVTRSRSGNNPPPGFRSLFNGRDLAHFPPNPKDGGHWRVVNGVIDYDALSEAQGWGKNLWSKEQFGDFELLIDWRIKPTREIQNKIDTGIYLRGTPKAQVNIWTDPMGSGEVRAYRLDKNLPAAVNRGATPSIKADRPVGQWNTFRIRMKGDRLNVILNGQTVLNNAHLPGVPGRGKLAFQHHGGKDPATGRYKHGSSLVQFRNIYIREL